MVFRSKVNEAERGDESQERDCDPDENKVNYSGSNHCLEVTAVYNNSCGVSFVHSGKVGAGR